MSPKVDFLFFSNSKKRTYMYELLQFPVEMNTRGSTMEKEYKRSFD